METNESISKSKMPSLESLELSLRSKRQLGKILGVHGPPTTVGKQIADGYVRLVEKAILEYECSRQKLNAFLKEGYADDYFRAQDHFETCINSLHRSILYLDRLRRLGFKTSNGLSFVPRPRELAVISESAQNRVRNFRDACEHLDQDIIEQKLPPVIEIGVHLGWERGKISDFEILYEDLANWLHQIHYFALLLRAYP